MSLKEQEPLVWRGQITTVRLRYVNEGRTPWKRHVTCFLCSWQMLSWDWERAHLWADSHARAHFSEERSA